jgi:transposase
MVICKRCGSGGAVKNGIVRGQQRYRCQTCACNFIAGDRRVNDDLAVKRALAVILYSLGKASFNMLGHIFGVSRSLTYRWIKEEAAKITLPPVSGSITEMEFDEMWHFIGSKKTKSGLSKRWIVAQGELWPGFSAIVMLPPSRGSTTRSNT